MRPTEGTAPPDREDVPFALRAAQGLADALRLPPVRRRPLPFGPRAGSGGQERRARRRSMRIGEEMQEFEREDVEPEAPSAVCILPGVDGTGIPMAPSEVEGVAGKQADGTAKTREAKTIVSARPAGIRRPGSLGGTRAAARPARASTARGRRAAPAGRRNSPSA